MAMAEAVGVAVALAVAVAVMVGLVVVVVVGVVVALAHGYIVLHAVFPACRVGWCLFFEQFCYCRTVAEQWTAKFFYF